jgi:hypothetical protein
MMRRSMNDDQFEALVMGLENMTNLVLPETETETTTETVSAAQ